MKIKEKTKKLLLGDICGKGFFFERSNTHVYSPQIRRLGTDTRRGQLDEPMSFIEVIYRIWVRGFSQRQK